MRPVRESVVDGSFYEANPAKLSLNISTLLQNADSFAQEDIQALIVPHAGYLFSGAVAATAYKTLKKRYKNIFLIGSSHHVDFDGVSLYNQGDYRTPLGLIRVNSEIIEKLIAENEFITYRAEAHKKEHTLEVQLPFLQSIYGDNLEIVPIIIASSELQTIQKLSLALEPYFNAENLFIISSDLAHYPKYQDANSVDMHLLKAVQKNSAQEFINAIVENEDSKIQNLQTSACGWSSILTLLYLTQTRDLHYELLEYKNSGDTPYGERDRVVGYSALRIYRHAQGFTLTQEQKVQAKEIATLALHEAVRYNRRVSIETKSLFAPLMEPLGAFVTLYLDKKLKGCIGEFEPHKPLYEVIIDMAIAASRYDKRFEPLRSEELENSSLEISVLTPRKAIESLEEIELGRDGIYIEYGQKSGTYLPHVAMQMQWSKEEFVQSCCLEKAGLTLEECKSAKISIYQAIVF